MALNNADAVKKNSHMFSDISCLVFDEFQSETNRYCSDEVKKFISIHTSIARGHSLKCRGVSDLLDEVDEDRKVKNKLIELLRADGNTVYDCTDDYSTTQGANLSSIVSKCNAHNVDLDISIHLNSARNDRAGDGKCGGVEVYGYDDRIYGVAIRLQRILPALLVLAFTVLQ